MSLKDQASPTLMPALRPSTESIPKMMENRSNVTLRIVINPENRKEMVCFVVFVWRVQPVRI